MAQYIIVYLGGNRPSSSEQAQQHFKSYMEWLSSLGDAVVSPANPLKGTCTVNPDRSVTQGGVSTMSGYTVIAANSMDEVLSMAKNCPFLDLGGSLEVSEFAAMPSQK